MRLLASDVAALRSDCVKTPSWDIIILSRWRVPAMSGFIEGEDRTQATLFPERIDDYITEENAVRVIDVFVDEIDLSGLGFKIVPEATGRPVIPPFLTEVKDGRLSS